MGGDGDDDDEGVFGDGKVGKHCIRHYMSFILGRI
jgi:hypothetical protein